MMESFQIALSVVGPLIIYMAVGMLVRKIGVCNEQTFKGINQLMFRVFIPLSLFFNASGADIGDLFQPVLFIGVELFLIGMTVVFWYALRKAVPDPRDHATVIQGIVRSNFVLFGSIVAASLCDERGVALTAAMSAFVVPTINVIGAVLFEKARGGKISPLSLLKAVFRNPLVAAGLLGILFAAFHLQLPALAADPLRKLGNAATPVAMVTLGGLLSYKSMKKHRSMIVMAVCGKLLILPAITITVGILAGFRGNELTVILAVFGAPTAVASTPMAQLMGGNGELAGEIVATTTILSLLTMFLTVMLLSGMGML